jgi:hypothetical protein
MNNGVEGPSALPEPMTQMMTNKAHKMLKLDCRPAPEGVDQILK